MTAPLRKRHLAAWVILSFALVLVIAAGLLARRTAVTPNPGISWEELR